jgi:hypothetical protein
VTADQIGIREARLTTKRFPIGFVAYCNYCNWSTGICVDQSEQSSLARATDRLNAHRKTTEHHAALTSTDGA